MNTLHTNSKIRFRNKGQLRELVIKTRDIISYISFDDDHIIVHMANGIKIGTTLKYFPRLKNANPDQRNKWELIGRGIGIHWEEIDEDISLKTLIRYGENLAHFDKN